VFVSIGWRIRYFLGTLLSYYMVLEDTVSSENNINERLKNAVVFLSFENRAQRSSHFTRTIHRPFTFGFVLSVG